MAQVPSLGRLPAVCDAVRPDLYARLQAHGPAAGLLAPMTAVVSLSDGLTAGELAGETRSPGNWIHGRTDAPQDQRRHAARASTAGVKEYRV